MSSFVVKYLHDCMASEWGEEVYIDTDLLNKMAIWITNQQDVDDGHFEDTSGVLYDRNMNVRKYYLLHQNKL